LHNGLTWRGITAHECRDPNEPIVTHHGNLSRVAVIQHVKQRDDAVDREVNIRLDCPGSCKILPKGNDVSRKFNRFTSLGDSAANS
jgi:hypothetical protein